MDTLSVIIIAKNSAATIEATLKSALLVSSDIIVIDSGSSDNTRQLVGNSGASWIEHHGKGLVKHVTTALHLLYMTLSYLWIQTK